VFAGTAGLLIRVPQKLSIFHPHPHSETFSVAVRVSNPDCMPVGIHG
jgi:hypothetical protein